MYIYKLYEKVLIKCRGGPGGNWQAYTGIKENVNVTNNFSA